jgi:hypothetical protein
MGTFLASALGGDYKAVGLAGYKVSINWPGVGTGELPPPTRADAVEVMLHELRTPFLFVDLAFGGVTDKFLKDGKVYELQGEEMVPNEQFDGLVFLDVSPMMEWLD